MRRPIAALACLLAPCGPAAALVGDAALAHWTLARPTVMVMAPTGGGCSGSVLAQDLVLTAAHCVRTPGDHKIAGYVGGTLYRVGEVTAIAAHPQYRPAPFLVADLALLKLAKALPSSFAPAVLSMRPVAKRDRVLVVGYGVTAPGQAQTAGVARMATLLVNSVSQHALWLVDPASGLERAGIGGCGGDSGAPAFAVRGGIPVLIGVVSGGSCGQTTTVIPLAPYRDWLVEMSRTLGSPLEPETASLPMR